jgi:hypothetical protein
MALQRALRAYRKYAGMPIRQVFHFGRDDSDFMKRTIGRILRRG